MRNLAVKPHMAKKAACLPYLALVVVAFCLSSCATDVGIFAGTNWQSSGLPNKHIRTLVVDPNNAQVLYAGNEQGFIFVSTDAGQHWQARNPGLPVPTTINVLSFDASAKKLYAATANGLFVSMDAAQHWNPVGIPASVLPVDSYTALAFDFNNPHTIYAGTAHHAVLISKDDAKSWSAAASDIPFHSVTNLTFDSNAHQLWAASELGIYRSDDGGTTWQALNSGLPSNIIVYTVQPASISGGARGLIFAGTNHGFFISQNSGAHWSPSQESLSGLSIYDVLVDFQMPTRVYVATNNGVFRSEDSGQSWGSVAPGIPEGAPAYALALGASDYSQLYAASNDVYLFPGNSGGLSATKLIPTLLILLFFYLLYRLLMRGRRRTQRMLNPERIGVSPPSTPASPPPDGLAPYNVVPAEKGQTNNVDSIDHRQEVSSEGEEGSE